jgi:flagellar hook-associated protein 1 FlgK
LPATPLTDVPIRIRLGDSLDRLAPLAGELNALMKGLNEDIPGARTRLDAMASQLVSVVNTTHRSGFVFNGNTIPGTAAGDFFAPGSMAAPVSAASIALSSDVAGNPSRIASSGNANAPTDNSIAQALSALRGTEGTVTYTSSTGGTETGSFLGFFRSVVTTIGIRTASATDDAAVADTLTDQANLRRQAVSGVNTDEELVNMLRIQQSYQAATKMIKAADEMLQTLISLV